MRIRYKQRVYLYSLGLSILFGVVLYLFVISGYKQVKREALAEELLIYCGIVGYQLNDNPPASELSERVQSILPLLPENIRVSILDEESKMLFDNYLLPEEIRNSPQFERLEIRKAILQGSSSLIRESQTTGVDFFFYVLAHGDYLIRIGTPYTDELKTWLTPDTRFSVVLIMLLLSAFVLVSTLYYSYQRSIKKVRDYIISLRKENSLPDNRVLPDDELGEIGELMTDAYLKLNESKKNINQEREKLLGHFQHSEEGISFFDSDHNTIYTNSRFIQYMNVLLDTPTFDVKDILQNPLFSEVTYFVNNPGKKKAYKTRIGNNSRYFDLRVIIFEDKSFEIIVRDISESERNRLNKAEVTNNIAHELKTPVTSIRGYLETLIETPGLAPEKQQNFIQRAYNQSIRLSEIIQDVTLITKTEDAPQFFTIEPINIGDIVTALLEEENKQITKSNINLVVNIGNDVVVNGNYTLLAAIFRNLLLNAVKYAGEGVTITINNYLEDDEYYYFSFADNGKGIDEKHLSHLFKRFYRITEGRTRDQGGSGLGLSITRKAVNFHNGEIYAKNRAEGGLEFLFTLKKQ